MVVVVLPAVIVVDVAAVVDWTVGGGSATVVVVDGASVRVTGWSEVVALVNPSPLLAHAAGATKASIQIAMLSDRVISPLLRRRGR